jgi:hypothetical protein
MMSLPWARQSGAGIPVRAGVVAPAVELVVTLDDRAEQRAVGIHAQRHRSCDAVACTNQDAIGEEPVVVLADRTLTMGRCAE